MPSYYCPHCKEPVEKAVYYPSDCAHPAEYIGPLCPVCGEEMGEYTCDICGKHGMPIDEVLAEDGENLICHECKAKQIYMSGKPIEEIKKEIYDTLIEKFEFKPDKFTEGYVDDLLEEFQKTIVELKRLKLMERPAVPLSEKSIQEEDDLLDDEDEDIEDFNLVKKYIDRAIDKLMNLLQCPESINERRDYIITLIDMYAKQLVNDMEIRDMELLCYPSYNDLKSMMKEEEE